MSRPPFGPRFSWRTADLRGAARIAAEATAGVARIVEGVHQSVLGSMGLPGAATPGRTRGITGLVYRSIHGVTRWVDKGVQTALHLLEPAAAGPEVSSARRDAVLAALNGVMGDRLAAEANPLALPLQLRQDGQALDLAALHAAGAATGKLLVLVHGLCMNDRQWLRAGHDHGAHLAQALGYTPVYVFYNTGLHIADNGRRLAEALEALLAAWPVPVQDLSVLGHSMGGLVARAACHHGAQTDQRWLGHLRHLVCLGTPHHGAPLERAGQWVQVLLGSTPYSRPFVRLARLRSAGITDLRHGQVRAPHVPGQGLADAREPTPLPAGVACFTVAAALAARRSPAAERLVGDGLVPLRSALGQHADPAHCLGFAPSHQQVVWKTGHLDLLGSPAVARQLVQWLQPPAGGPALATMRSGNPQ